MIIAVMLGSLVMSAVIPDAFGERGLIFAVAFISTQLGRTMFAARGHELQRNFERMLFWSVLSAVPWVVGALLLTDSFARLATYAPVFEPTFLS